MGSTIQFGIFCFVVFFGFSQFFQWAQHLTLPLPIFILGGAFLAIASNFNKRAGLPFSLLNDLNRETVADATPAETAPKAPKASEADPSTASAELPPSQTTPIQKPISFRIKQPEK